MDLLCGDVVAARQAYDRAVQHAGRTKRDQMAYLGSFPGLLHTLLLIQSEAQSGSGPNRQQARTWLNWLLKGGSHAVYYGAYFFLDALLTFCEGRARAGRTGWRRPIVRNPLGLLGHLPDGRCSTVSTLRCQGLRARDGEALAVWRICWAGGTGRGPAGRSCRFPA